MVSYTSPDLSKHWREAAGHREEVGRLKEVLDGERASRVGAHGDLSQRVADLEERLSVEVEELKRSLGVERTARGVVEEAALAACGARLRVRAYTLGWPIEKRRQNRRPMRRAVRMYHASLLSLNRGK